MRNLSKITMPKVFCGKGAYNSLFFNFVDGECCVESTYELWKSPHWGIWQSCFNVFKTKELKTSKQFKLVYYNFELFLLHLKNVVKIKILFSYLKTDQISKENPRIKNKKLHKQPSMLKE